jgi:uncharacterized protein (DUF488 family)
MAFESVATIGYEGATMPAFLETVRAASVELVVDIRAVASSRRPGFAKTALASSLETVDVEYLHLRGLGTPADGRAAARAGRHDELRRIYLTHLATDGAQAELEIVAGLIRSGRRLCLLCFEADAARCHRSFVADALVSKLGVQVVNLAPQHEEK